MRSLARIAIVREGERSPAQTHATLKLLRARLGVPAREKAVSGDATDNERPTDADQGDGERTVTPEQTTIEGTVIEGTVIEGRSPGSLSAGPLLVRWHDGERAQHGEFGTAFTIGRDSACEVTVGDAAVSRRHAELVPINGRWHVRDLGSGNGTLLDDVRVTDAIVPRHATLQLGATTRVALESPGAPDLTSEEILAQRYFSGAPDDTNEIVGGRTQMVRNAYRRVEREQKRRYRSIIAGVAIALLAIAAFAYNQYQALGRTRELATEIFYAMKAVELQVVGIEDRIRESGDQALLDEVASRRNEVRALEEQYDRFLEELDVLGSGLSEEDRVILRVARLFGECELTMPDDFVAEVKRYIHEWKLSPRLRTAVARMSAQNLTTLVGDAMVARNLPPQYLYVALQESSFDPDAIGPKTRFGIAKGMWQFIPSTARRYGLRTGPLVELAKADPNDDRHDPLKATQAAADYLHDIYARDAQASGLLVMASYNWGPNNVRRRLRDMPANPRERNFWKLLQEHKIPKETYDYVFYIVSAAVIGENPELFGFHFEAPLSGYEIRETAAPEGTETSGT